MSSLPDRRHRFTNTMGGRIALAMHAAVLYSGVGAFEYDAWIAVASARPGIPQPTVETVFLCGFIAIVLAIVQYDRFEGIIVMTICGLLVGSCIFPNTSMGGVARVAAIRDGHWALFTSYGLCLGAFLGTLLGQNLVEIQRAINRVYSRSLRLTRAGAHS